MVLAHWLLHPLNGLGYQFYSGIGSSVSEWLTILLAISVYVRRHNCHQHRCPFLAWHPHPDDPDGHPICRWHHPHHRGLLTKLTRKRNVKTAPLVPGPGDAP